MRKAPLPAQRLACRGNALLLFSSLDCGYCPASGPGSLRPPYSPLSRVVTGVAIACRVPCPPLAAGASRRARLAGLVGRVAVRASASGEHFPHHQHRLSGTVHGTNKGKPSFTTHIKGRHTACGAGATIPLADVSAAGRGGDRRPERGGSSDAGRTLVPRGRGTAGGRTPAAARQRGGQRYASRIRVARQGWLPQRGVGGRRGQGAAQAPAPCPPLGGDHAPMPGSSRKTTAIKVACVP